MPKINVAESDAENELAEMAGNIIAGTVTLGKLKRINHKWSSTNADPDLHDRRTRNRRQKNTVNLKRWFLEHVPWELMHYRFITSNAYYL